MPTCTRSERGNGLLQNFFEPYPCNWDCDADIISKVHAFGFSLEQFCPEARWPSLFDASMQGDKQTGTHMFIDPSDHKAMVWGLDLVSNECGHHMDRSLEPRSFGSQHFPIQECFGDEWRRKGHFGLSRNIWLGTGRLRGKGQRA